MDSVIRKQSSLEDQLASRTQEVDNAVSKMVLIHDTLIPDLKAKIKAIKKSAGGELPTKNKIAVERLSAGLERARHQIAVIENDKEKTKPKTVQTDVKSILGKL